VLGVGILLLLFLFGRNEGAWKKKLAETVLVLQTLKTADSTRYQLQRGKDSTELAQKDSTTRADSLKLAGTLRDRAVAVREAQRARLSVDSAQKALRLAGTLGDTVVALPALLNTHGEAIARLTEVIENDSTALKQGADVQAGLRSQLGVLQRQRDTERERADTAEARLGKLLKAAKPPKGLNFLGIRLAVKPYLGVGVNVSASGQVQPGAQLGLSLLRGQ
jgi:hypothetical protein